MKPLLVVGPDSTLRDVFYIAKEQYPERSVKMLAIPSRDYYDFDLAVLHEYSADKWAVCVVVNEFYINDVRRSLTDAIQKLGYALVGCTSLHACISPTAQIGIGNIIHPGVVISAGVVVGNHTVIRPNVVIAEDSNIGNFSTLESNVSIRESCEIGDFSTVCANSNLMRMTHVGKNCYLNISRQYSGVIPDKTFYSPLFQKEVRILPVVRG